MPQREGTNSVVMMMVMPMMVVMIVPVIMIAIRPAYMIMVVMMSMIVVMIILISFCLQPALHISRLGFGIIQPAFKRAA